jgi:photosystem II stability/assembly factor-like uncharacterized protein
MLLESLLAVAVAGGWETHGPAPSVSVVAVAGPDSRRIYAIAGSVFRSDDGGETWLRIVDAPSADTFYTLGVDPGNPDTLFAATYQVGPHSRFATKFYRSVDGGNTWTLQLAVLDIPICSVAFDGLRPNTVYVACGSTHSLFLRSEDGGDSFEGAGSPFLGGTKLQIAADSSILAVTSGGIWGSRDGGRTWYMPISSPGGCDITSLVIDPENPNRMFVGEGSTQPPCSGVLRSLDGGVTWSRTANVGGSVLDLVMDPSDPARIYVVAAPVGRPGRVLVSSDDGQIWHDLGLPVTAGVNDLALTNTGDRLYAATTEGVFARSLRRTRAITPRP